MKLIDANILLYAVDETAPHHLRAKSWLDAALSSAETVVIPSLCLVAFTRISTNPRLYESPLTTDEALDQVEAWCGATPVRTELAHPMPIKTLRSMLQTCGTGGNLVNDAYLASLAIELGATLVSFDNDFDRFTGLDWLNLSKSQDWRPGVAGANRAGTRDSASPLRLNSVRNDGGGMS